MHLQMHDEMCRGCSPAGVAMMVQMWPPAWYHLSEQTRE
jgi:hypothetical protein